MNNSDQSHEQHADGIVEAGQKAPIYFYLLYFGLIAWAVIFMGYYLFSGWSSDGELQENLAAHQATYNPEAATEATSAGNAKADAAALFASNCAGCHGEDGTGGFGSDLSSPAYKYGALPEAIRLSIADGRGGMMPAFAGQLSDAEIDALTDYCLNLQQ